jgi:hypothetical protein
MFKNVCLIIASSRQFNIAAVRIRIRSSHIIINNDKSDIFYPRLRIMIHNT